MTIDTKALREAAERATPGEWHARHDDEVWVDGRYVATGEPNQNTTYLIAAQPRNILSLLDELDALRKRVEELEGGWQPIETAPKDGTWVELWRGTTKTGIWSPLVIARWWAPDGEDEGVWAWPDDIYDPWHGKEAAEACLERDDYYESTINFTHWRPLPEPPNE